MTGSDAVVPGFGRYVTPNSCFNSLMGHKRSRSGYWVVGFFAVAALLTGLISPVSAEEDKQVERPVIHEPLERIELSEDPFPESGLGIPDGILMSEEEIQAERVDSVDIEAWTEDRVFFGFKALDKPTPDEIDQLLETRSEYGFPLFPEEVDIFVQWQSTNERLIAFYAKVQDAEQLAQGIIDEPTNTLTLWVKDVNHEVLASPPPGVTIKEVGFSKPEIDSFLQSPGVVALLKAAGSIDEIDVKGEGILIYLVANEEAQKSAEILEPLLRKDAPAPVTVQVRVQTKVSKDHCSNRVRCDGFNGGMIWGTVGSGECTSGFALRNATGTDRGLSTAGHCGDPLDNFRVRGSDWSRTGTTASSAQNIIVEVNNASFDMQIMSRPSDTNSGAYVPTYYRDSTYGNQPVTAIQDPVIDGLSVCLSARNSVGRRCGTIGDADYNGAGNVGAIRIDWNTGGVVVSAGGDSGGTIARQALAHIAVSTHVATITPGSTNEFDGVSFAAANTPGAMSGWRVLLAPDTKRGRVEHFVANRVYQAGLQRQPSISELDYWAGQVDNSGSCLATAQWFLKHVFSTEVASALPINTGNATTNVNNRRRRVHRLYWAMFNRAGDVGGVNYWTTQFSNQATWESVVTFFSGHAETTNAIQYLRGQEEGPC